MSVTIEASVIKNVNYAACQCGAGLISSVQIKGNPGQEVILSIKSVPKFLYEYKEKITLDHGKVNLSNVQVHLDDVFCRQEILDAKEATIQIEIYDANDVGKTLAYENKKVHLQPYLHWNRSEHEESLIAFMQPNDPLVARVLNRAGELANEENGRMVGYQNWKNSSTRKQAEWIYRALQEENIHYLCPPAGFEFGASGQKVRIPGMVLHENVKQGTCLDLAILYASCLEAASFNSMVFLICGHAFTGVWLDNEKNFSTYPCKDWNLVDQNVKLSEGILPVECTFFTDGLNYSFEQAITSAKNNLQDADKFQCVLDVHMGRTKGYVPAYTFTNQPLCDLGMDDFHMNPSSYGQNKRQRLIKQAMDFSMRNVLLSKAGLVSELRFEIDAEKFFNDKFTDAELFVAMQKQQSVKKNIEDTLFDLNSFNRQEQQETGHNIVYLAVNELEWTAKGQEEKRKAPLYLCPSEIYRNIRGEYRFCVKVNESFVNPVLKVYLYQEYGIDFSELLNQPHEDYNKQIQVMKFAIGRQNGWKIIENVCGLSVYPVPNQAIWKGLQDDQLLKHDIVQGFLEGAMTWDNNVKVDIDAAEEPTDIYTFQADDSQREVIESTFKKRAQVIIGPAGNGKSQTIANIITEHMRKGQKVLFVTEKPTAMEVVADMLNQAEMTPFYLMLPDGKGTVAGLHEKVEATLRYVANYHGKQNSSLDVKKKIYKDAYDRLEQFRIFMKKPVVQGKSLAQLLEEYEQFKDYVLDEYCLTDGEVLNHESAENVMESFAEMMKNHPDVQTEYLPFINCLDLSDEERSKALVLIDQALAKMSVLKQKIWNLGDRLKVDMNGLSERDQILRVMTYASALQKCPVYGPSFKVVTKEQDEEFGELLHLTKELMASTPGSYHYEDVGDTLWTKVDEHQQKAEETDWSVLSKFAIQDSFSGISKEQMAEIKKKQTYDKYCMALIKQAEGRSEAEKEGLQNAANNIVQGNGKELLEDIKILNLVYKSYMELQKTAEVMIIRNTDAFAMKYPDKMMADLFSEWKKCQDKLVDIKIYMANSKKAEDIGLGNVIRHMEENILTEKLSVEDMMQTFRKARCRYNIEKICKEHPEWTDFARVDYAVCLKQYRENEEILREAYRKDILNEIVSHMPDLKEGSADNPELGALQRLIRRESKQTSIYKIFDEAFHTLQQIFPCMMMGPESVAEYIPAAVMDYDIVIFDEASQLPSYKAMIPISKGKKCVFIGDEKQLTPTTFFKKNILDEDGTETPQEAILEDAIVTSMPQKMLRYHYRSQYENLVAFSNDRYYHKEIVTFPGSDTQVKGVEYIYVEDGCYDRGGARNNVKEAEKVLELIQKIYKELPEDTTDTLGVITFNMEQMRLIRKMLKEALHEVPDLKRPLYELVDVVNLEACQGKEWDRTILSTAYGRDKEGNFSTNLGPMTRDDGGNRLNVMITRSRKHLYVVTSLTPDMFGDEQKAGNKDLRDFLAFAKGDLKLDSREVGVGKEAKGLMASVVKHLEDKGYQVHTNIGSSSCKVDIGIISEENYAYKLGILLDHFENEAHSVRDEEIIIPAILANKGWKLYRLHALNWYENSKYELEKIEKLMK